MSEKQTTPPRIEWAHGIDRDRTENVWRELWWYVRRGKVETNRNIRPWIFGIQRFWYDGPIWSFYLGPISIHLLAG